MEQFWYVSRQTNFLDSIFLLVASVKSYAKSPKAFALVFLQTVCISAYYEIPTASKIAARSDLRGKSFLPASAINRGVFENY